MTKLDDMTLEALQRALESGDVTIEEALAWIINDLGNLRKWLSHGAVVIASAQEQFPKGRAM